jgi:outer membrane protein OmpA-like peptidoglycan-associated protein
MADPKLGDLAIRVTVVGHASPRWRGAKNPTEADRLNLRLSELRAQNVRGVVEGILKRELPSLPIAVPSKGVGSHERFPAVSEDNAAIDRSVVVMVELTHTRHDYEWVPQPPRRISAASKLWLMQVRSLLRGAGIGAQLFQIRLSLKNPYSGKSIQLTGWLFGGGAAGGVGDSFRTPGPSDIKKLWKGKVGVEVLFSTPQAMLFNDFDGQFVRMHRLGAKFGIGFEGTFLNFIGLKTKPDYLFFEPGSFSLSLKPDVDAFVVGGKLGIEGDNPGDFYEVPRPADIVPIQTTQHNTDGLIVGFDTEKADVTDRERKRLDDFVTNKARNIAVLAQSYNVAHP